MEREVWVVEVWNGVASLPCRMFLHEDEVDIFCRGLDMNYRVVRYVPEEKEK